MSTTDTAAERRAENLLPCPNCDGACCGNAGAPDGCGVHPAGCVYGGDDGGAHWSARIGCERTHDGDLPAFWCNLDPRLPIARAWLHQYGGGFAWRPDGSTHRLAPGELPYLGPGLRAFVDAWLREQTGRGIPDGVMVGDPDA